MLIHCKECGREISSKSVTCPGCGAPVKPKSSARRAVAGTLFLLVIIWIGYVTSDNKSSTSPPTHQPASVAPVETATPEPQPASVAPATPEPQSASVAPVEAATPEQEHYGVAFDHRVPVKGNESPVATFKLEITKHEWQKSFGVAVWHITFRNNSDRPISNIAYRTTYWAENEEVVDRGGVDARLSPEVYTIKRVIPPHSKRPLEINDGFVNHEAVRASFEIVSCEFVTN